MKGTLTGKTMRGYLWAGPGNAWSKKQNYFQVENEQIISAALFCSSGSFWLRCKGATCEVRLYDLKNRILSTTVLTPAHGRK
jgi:hypothetical protein